MWLLSTGDVLQDSRGRRVPTRPAAAAMLRVLARTPGQVWAWDDIIANPGCPGSRKYLDRLLTEMRAVLGPHAVTTVRGKGVMLEAGVVEVSDCVVPVPARLRGALEAAARREGITLEAAAALAIEEFCG